MNRDEAIKAMRDEGKIIRWEGEDYEYRYNTDEGRVEYRASRVSWTDHSDYDGTLFAPEYDTGWHVVMEKTKRTLERWAVISKDGTSLVTFPTESAASDFVGKRSSYIVKLTGEYTTEE